MGKGFTQGSNKDWFNWLTWKTRADAEPLIQMNYIRKDVEVGDIKQENEPGKTWIAQMVAKKAARKRRSR